MTSHTIELLEDLLGKLQHLLPENQQLLLTFAEFLLERQMRSIPEKTSVYFKQISPQSLRSRVDIENWRRDENHLYNGHSFYITGETGVE